MPQSERGTGMDVAGIITAVGGVIALLIKVCGLPQKRRKAVDVADRLEHLEQRLELAEDKLLGWAAWAHDARVRSAAHGLRLAAIPGRLVGSGDAHAIPSPRQADAATHADA